MRIRLYPVFLFLFIALITGCSSAPDNVPGVSLELAEYRSERITDLSYELEFSIPEDENDPIPAHATIRFLLDEEVSDLWLDFRESGDQLLNILINGQADSINFTNEHLYLPAEMLQAGANEVEIEFMAGESSLNRNPDYLYTLFVPDRARTAFPLFDQPDLKARFTLHLETPVEWEAVSNGPTVSVTEEGDRKSWEFETTEPISSYVFSFAAGAFERVTRTTDGREMNLLHRETDQEKVERNLDEIFRLHEKSIAWLEDYTGIDYPFRKLDFALIPSFQYGGMEHTGAIQYRASSLFLDKSPAENQLLGRASLIAHEVAHMWFGNLVTMEWFNDVWTKEVFANFMASKIVNPEFPETDHDLNFLIRHYPSAYSVDRTEGANPIRQQLDNLNEAGQMYGAIIYNKAPIMMRQLEMLLGEDTFREGLQEYLSTYSYSNATWPDLIDILDQKTDMNLKQWSQTWVNTPGRPSFSMRDVHLVREDLNYELKYDVLIQEDPAGKGRIWAQETAIWGLTPDSLIQYYPVTSDTLEVFATLQKLRKENIVYNANGKGYGYFPANMLSFNEWRFMRDIIKGAQLINVYENILEGEITPEAYLDKLKVLVQGDEKELLLSLMLRHVQSLYWDLLSPEDRDRLEPEWESVLWKAMSDNSNPSTKKMFFQAYQGIASNSDAVQKLYDIWNSQQAPAGVTLSENDYTRLAANLAIRLPDQADEILNEQLSRISNPDRKRRFEFTMPALSADPSVRDSFFESLKDEENRETESWVLAALGYLHHPLRIEESEKYILPSLELLEEIQQTGDIFFPKGWLDATLGDHHSDSAVQTIRTFLEERPDYNAQLRMKILQSADPVFRANKILNQEETQ